MTIRNTLTAAAIAIPTVFAAGVANAATITETAADDPRFSTLTKALQATGLDETLSMDGPYTVFAPTNEAFDKLPADELQALMMPENKDRLRAILTYHVVPGALSGQDAIRKSGLNPQTVQGEAVMIDGTGGGIYYDDAEVVVSDIQADNGVIHAIDSVAMPDM